MANRDLYDQYRKAVHAARRALDLSAEGGTVTEAERLAEHDAAMADARRYFELAEAEERLAQLSDDYGAELDVIGTHLRGLFLRNHKQFDVTWSKPRGRERRVQSELSSAAGSFLVGRGFVDRVTEHAQQASAVLRLARLIETDDGRPVDVPTTTAHGAATVTTEAGAFTSVDSTFSQVQLGAFKYARAVTATQELLEDASQDLLAYFERDCGRGIGRLFGQHAITGTGTGQAQGVAAAATVGVTGGTGVSGAFTADNLVDLYYSVTDAYRSSERCAWVMRDATLAAARKLKDSQGYYLWQPSPALGQPETLMGRPVYIDENVAAVGLSARSVLFGDWMAYGVRRTRSMQFLTSAAGPGLFNVGLVQARGTWRMDGRLLDSTGAIKAFVGGAT